MPTHDQVKAIIEQMRIRVAEGLSISCTRDEGITLAMAYEQVVANLNTASKDMIRAAQAINESDKAAMDCAHELRRITIAFTQSQADLAAAMKVVEALRPAMGWLESAYDEYKEGLDRCSAPVYEATRPIIANLRAALAALAGGEGMKHE